MSTDGARKTQIACNDRPMAIGKRIEQRLDALEWKRRDLMERVPELTPQALANLINRDSVRSEWDLRIAEALGVSVLWLVYGIEHNYASVGTAPNVTALEVREPALQELIEVAGRLSERGVYELIGMARTLSGIHPKTPAHPTANAAQ